MRSSIPGLVGALAIACGGQESVERTDAARADRTPTYLALGDSVPFGLDPRLVPSPAFSCFSCGSFTSPVAPRNENVFVGYPEYLQERLGVPLENASCPGETSASFGAPAAAGQAAICAEFKANAWLHAAYGGAQRAHALAYLESHPAAELVTLTLGANDVLDLVAGCGGDPTCVYDGLGGVLTAVRANVSGILSDVRSAGYAGRIVVPLYYAPSPEWTGLLTALNHELRLAAAPSGAVAVDLQALFGADACGDGLLIPLDPSDLAAGCDMHPSGAGARLIAAAIAGALKR